MPQTNERKLRCPRCGTGAPVSTGKCPSCGLPIYTSRIRERLGPDKPQPPRFLSGRFKQKRARSAARPRKEVKEPSTNDFGGVSLEQPDLDMTPKRKHKVAEMPKASGETDLYQLDGLTDIHDQAPEEAEAAPDPAPAKGGPVKDEETPVGTMAEFLMNPSDNPEETSRESSHYFAKSDIKLDLAPWKNAEAAKKERAPEPEAWKPEPAEPKAQPARKTSQKQAGEVEAGAGRFWLKWALPQLVLLAAVVLVGPNIVQKVTRVEGYYQAFFTDETGRSVTCRTLFSPQPNDPYQLLGFFECQLYPNEYSTERVDEPRVLKPVMGSGKIAYEGHYNNRTLSLILLGANGSREAGAVELLIKFTDGRKTMEGVASSPLGQRGTVRLTSLKLPE